MAGGSKLRKRVKAETPNSSSSSSSAAVLKRAKNGSAFTRCQDCNKDVAMALIDFHSCSLDAKIKMNLEARVVEIPKKPSAIVAAAEKRKAKSTNNGKKKENANGRKRPQTAFFLFMDDFRKQFKAENRDCKNVATMAKEGGEKWKSMSDVEKKVYVDRAAELKAEYEKACSDEGNGEEGKEDLQIVEVEGDDGELTEIESKHENIEWDGD